MKTEYTASVGMDSMSIPAYMLEALNAYIEQGHPVGNFLTAVLENNLKEAVGRADSTNILCIPAYVIYLYNEAPSACWGSPEKVAAWCGTAEMEATNGS